MKMNKLNDLRKKINEIDKTIVSLLEKRIQIAEDVAIVKDKNNLPLTDSKREAEIINSLIKKVQNVILKEKIPPIFKEIMSISKNVRILKKNQLIPFKKIGVIGLGLIGGSIIKAIKTKTSDVLIFSLKRKSLDNKLALNKKFIDKELNNLKEMVNTVDLIILSSPIDTLIPLAKQIKENAQPSSKNLIVIDTGSTKEKIADAFEKLTDGLIEFVATHPMAGSEKSGFENSKATLFINQPWIITLHKKNSIHALDMVDSFISSLGARLEVLNAKKHDQLIAAVSHLPFIIAVLIFAYIKNQKQKGLEFSGSGFRNITRLASGNALMHEQIYRNNSLNINKELKKFIKFLTKILKKKEKNLAFFQKIKNDRDKFYGS